MKKVLKKSGSMVLCIALMASVFAGCQSKAKPNEVNTAASTQTPPAKIRIFNKVNADVNIDGNPLLKEIEKQANVILTYEAPPINSYADKLQIVMASGDLPDIVNCGPDANYEKWAQNGLLAVLDDKISKYPNLVSNISKETWEAVRSVNTGKIHEVPRMNTVGDWGYMINQNWLDKLGLKAPTTLDEFTNVCRAFATQDPDGNGKNDTYGVSFGGSSLGNNSIWNYTAFLTNAFDIPIIAGSKDVDGNFKIKEKSAGYFPYLNYLKQLISEKLLDPEFITNKQYGEQDKLYQNRVGIAYGHQSAVLGALKTVPDAITKFTYNAPIANAKGERICYVTPSFWGAWMITKNANVDACLKFLDWANSKDGFILNSLGIKGVNYSDYDFSNRYVTRTPEQSKQLQNITSSYFTFAFALDGKSAIIENGDTPERIAKYNKDYDAAKKVIKEISLPIIRTPKLQTFNTTNPDDVKKKDANEIKFVLGEISEQQYKDYLNNEYFPKIADAEKEYIEVCKKTLP